MERKNRKYERECDKKHYTFTVRLPLEYKDMVENICEELQIPRSEVINRAIALYYEHYRDEI